LLSAALWRKRTSRADAQSDTGARPDRLLVCGDLWVVSRDGAMPRVTNGIGNEYAPIFPLMVAGSLHRRIYGNTDVYVIPAKACAAAIDLPSRNDTAVAGARQQAGALVSGRDSASGRYARLFTMAIDGVFDAAAVPMGYEAPTRRRLPPGLRALPAGSMRGNVIGGMTTAIWISNLSDLNEKLPRDQFHDFTQCGLVTKSTFYPTVAARSRSSLMTPVEEG